MNKVKKIFNSLILSFMMIGILVFGISIFNDKQFLSSQASLQEYETISNSLPEYFIVNTSTDSGSSVGNVGNTIYLFQTGGNKNIKIGNKIINIPNTTPGQNSNTNYAYFSGDNDSADLSDQQNFYYFDFQNSLSLYYNLTNAQISQGMTGTNLMQLQNISNYAKSTENSVVTTYNFTPQQLDINFKLDTSLDSIKFGTEEIDKNTITLNKEGCYTLAIPFLEYYTDNGGLTFTSSEKTIYYTFMIFNANTYFNSTTGLPNLTISSNLQQTVLPTTNSYSRYYFYNFSCGNIDNSLPTIKFNPNIYQIKINYTDIEQNTSSITLEYNNKSFKQLDENGNEISKEDYVIQTNIISNDQASIVFYELGCYDFSFTYLYKVASNNNEITYKIPLEELSSSSVFNNKNQRLYLYGFKSAYSDYSNINSLTNQPESVDLKNIDYTTATYSNSADITSKITNSLLNTDVNSVYKQPVVSQSSNFALENLLKKSLEYINNNNIKPVSTNQTPIKFINNVTLLSSFSKIYTLSTNDDGKFITNNNTEFSGFNQNSPGTYLYIIQYNFGDYMSTSGTLQSAFCHYQIFFFQVTNTVPTVTVLDENFNEIYTNGFTNKNVYILNDSENNMYDAKVQITLSALNYQTGSYFFQDVDIKNLTSYGITYQTFEEAQDNDLYNSKVAGKQGILIEKTSSIANAIFTIKITTNNTEKPSSRTFTIDTSEIQNITARNVSLSTSTEYKIGESFSSYSTNQPMIFSWSEKKSNAATYGFVKYIPMENINYYTAQTNSDQLSNLLTYLIQLSSTLPVSYKLNLNNSSNWSEYKNSISFANTINATYVKSNDGFYILEIYDQAGNSAFEIFLLDSSSPIFVQTIQGRSVVRKLMSNSEIISIPEENTTISIEWSDNKAIYIENPTAYQSITSYQYGVDVENAQIKLQETLNNFFNSLKNSDIQSISGLGAFAVNGEINAGIESYNGTYLIIPINDKVYIKDTQPNSSYSPYNGSNYKITFIDENNKALEGTYKILLRDQSNTQFTKDEETNYKNYSSSYLSFNVTSDASKLSINFDDGGIIDVAGFNLTGELYSYEKDGVTYYTHDVNSIEGEDYSQTNLSYKFAYYTPINADEKITLYYVPFPENGSVVDSIMLYYYPYEVNPKKIGDVTYFYYDISETIESTTVIYKKSDNNIIDPGKIKDFEIILGSSETPKAGRYVIERTYIKGDITDQYDYFRRTITFIVDDFNLISSLESVKDDNQNSTLESIVGGDIILSMYSGENNSAIEISFPSISADTGLNNGSFYTKDSFGDETFESFSVSGNKLPMSLYIPKYKYTTHTQSSVNKNNGKEYSVFNNNNLSYYGNARVEKNENNYFDVIVEGIVVQTFNTEQKAYEYLNNYVTIAEYEIFAEIQFTPTSTGNVTTYCSNGTTTNGFLNIYQSDEGHIADGTNPTQYFYQEGTYVVTIYQANNIGNESYFYDFYKFGFQILSEEPSFDIIGSDGYILSSTTSKDTYYTNSDFLTIQWENPTSQYQAKIDESMIQIKSFPQTVARSEVKDGNNTRYFEIDTSSLITANNSYLQITMQYEGFNSNYYKRITKTIYFDRSAPTQNLQNLMTNTENATNKAFTKNYQQIYMRRYFNYKNEEQAVNASTDLSLLSYSYSINTGNFKYYSYNVTKEFFTTTLKETLTNSSAFPYDTQSIYFKQIPNLDESYIQVDKASFSSSIYWDLSISSPSDFVSGYYEVVELDYAKNMCVYLVYVIDSYDENDANVRTDALSYTNSQHPNTQKVYDNEITTGYNIYSNSGFILKDINYKSDPWQLFYLKISNQSEIRYMKSPWLSNNYVYKVIFNSSGIQFEQVTLSSLFENVESSSTKHSITLSDRTIGTNQKIYLSIMDASLNVEKVEDPLKTSAILNISVPSLDQYQSTTTSYIFPTSITIYQFDSTSTEVDKWEIIMIANQDPYGTWTPIKDFINNSYISFTTLPNNTTLQIAINLGANASQKVKYKITDNFRNTTTLIQLANETSYVEVTGNSTIYQISESDGSITYLSDQTINYSYNTLLYKVQIFDKDGNDVTSLIEKSENALNNIYIYKFNPPNNLNWDEYYKIVIRDNESENIIKTINIRLYNKLPSISNSLNDLPNGGIIFNDKNQKPIDDIGNITSMTVDFYGVPYTSSAQTITTYSQNVSIFLSNGASLAYEGNFHYQDGYSFSTYLSRDNGLTWELISGEETSTSGFTISGSGEYLILVKYDSNSIFTNLCRIYQITILDSSTSYYYIAVDGNSVSKSNITFTDNMGYEYETNYIVSVNYLTDKNNRLTITPNEELNVKIDFISASSTGTEVWVEVYYYSCSESVGYFTIIYIEETNNIVNQFIYETASGFTSSIKSESTVTIVAEKDDTYFDKLKLSFTAYYGIEQNKINIEVLKLFNGKYVTIYPQVYNNGDVSYVYIEKAGTYRVSLYDSCTPANVQKFKNSNYLDIIFLNSVPFIITTTDNDGNQIITEPIQNAVYNNSVKLSLTNLSIYYQRYPEISVLKNGLTYSSASSSNSSGYILTNNEYTFTEPGFYTIKFSATSTTNISIREEEFNFTIINKNESRYAYEFTNYSNYYVKQVIRNGIDITDDLVQISNFDKILINNKQYLSELIISYLDEKTGSGRYVVTISPNNSAYINTIGSTFSFEFWINMQTPPILVSIPEGSSTTDNISITFNLQNYYNAVGDSYIKIANNYFYYTSDTIPTMSETQTLNITSTGVYFIQIYSTSGHLLHSYKVEKTEPLNAFAVIAIIFGVIAVGAIIGITVGLRKRQKIK